eukprot:2480-Heterococcus_DN1.PRE.1
MLALVLLTSWLRAHTATEVQAEHSVRNAASAQQTTERVNCYIHSYSWHTDTLEQQCTTLRSSR